MQANSLQYAGEPSDPHEAAQLFPLVYNELHRLAAHRLAREPPGQTLQPTALVHEVYLRLVGTGAPVYWNDRAHFFAAAAEAMRRILIENARHKKTLKRGRGTARQDLDALELLAPAPREDLLAVDEALTKLAATNPTAAKLVELRYFAGMSIPEAAPVLRISTRTANRLWSYARAWLYKEIESSGRGKEPS
jgi:RNA polymerase sigma factor (TIGR02999 family)